MPLCVCECKSEDLFSVVLMVGNNLLQIYFCLVLCTPSSLLWCFLSFSIFPQESHWITTKQKNEWLKNPGVEEVCFWIKLDYPSINFLFPPMAGSLRSISLSKAPCQSFSDWLHCNDILIWKRMEKNVVFFFNICCICAYQLEKPPEWSRVKGQCKLWWHNNLMWHRLQFVWGAV